MASTQPHQNSPSAQQIVVSTTTGKTWISELKFIGFIKYKVNRLESVFEDMCIYQMNIIFQKEKLNDFTLLVIFIVNSLGIEVLNDGTVIATFHHFWFNRF